jgi:hypothetical protein
MENMRSVELPYGLWQYDIQHLAPVVKRIIIPRF